MAAVWPLKMPPTAKAVLVSLADQANDQGVSWPSIGTITARTCLDDRTVQRALNWLLENGYIERNERAGRSTVYRVLIVGAPRHSDTPDLPSPPSERHHTPVTVTPHPRQSDGQNRKGTVREPSVSIETGSVAAGEDDFDRSSDPTRELFDLGLAVLTRVGVSERSARSLVGRLRGRLGDAEAMGALLTAKSKTDPSAYLAAAIKKPRIESHASVIATLTGRNVVNAEAKWISEPKNCLTVS